MGAHRAAFAPSVGVTERAAGDLLGAQLGHSPAFGDGGLVGLALPLSLGRLDGLTSSSAGAARRRVQRVPMLRAAGNRRLIGWGLVAFSRVTSVTIPL